MNIQVIPITRINPAPYNPRADLQPDDSEYRKIKRSLETFGYVEPLVWNERTETLISGHQRLKILISQKVQEVEVSVVDLSVEQEKALNIALNRIQGRWDETKLAILLEELCELPDFEVGLTGFDQPDVSALFDKVAAAQDEDDFDVEAEVDQIDVPITQKGDLKSGDTIPILRELSIVII